MPALREKKINEAKSMEGRRLKPPMKAVATNNYPQ